jgi:hypothetical protein
MDTLALDLEVGKILDKWRGLVHTYDECHREQLQIDKKRGVQMTVAHLEYEVLHRRASEALADVETLVHEIKMLTDEIKYLKERQKHYGF